MEPIARLKRDHRILRSKFDVLESALRMGPETWFVLREVCYSLSRLLCPSGEYPLSAGNIRSTPLQAIYQSSPLLQALRDPDRLKGRCGACEYRAICGGSRSRAFALTGDHLAEEPCCAC